MSYRIVILKSKTTSLKQAEQFLTNRQWDVYSTVDLREAIAAVLKREPEFVMIAADHPSGRAKGLPKVIMQAVSTNFICFVESGVGTSMAALNEMKSTYNLFPPISGPSIERMALRIKKDLAQAAIEPEKKASVEKNRLQSDGTQKNQNKEGYFPDSKTFEGGKPSGGVVRISGNQSKAWGHPGGISPDDIMSQIESHTQQDSQSKNDAGAAYLGSAMNQNPSQDSANSFNTGAAYNPGFNKPQNSAEPNHQQAAYLGNSGSQASPHFKASDPSGFESFKHNQVYESKKEGDDPAAFASLEDRQAMIMDSFGAQDRQHQGPSFYNPQEPGDQSNSNSLPEFEGAKPRNDIYNPNSTQANDKNPGSPGHGDYQDPNRSFAFQQSQNRESKIGPAPDLSPSSKKELDANHSMLSEGVAASMVESVEPMIEPPGAEILKTTNVSCIAIESTRFAGYLVAAMGKNKKIDASLIETIKGRLITFLKSRGELLDHEDSPMDLNLKEVPFEAWAIEQAEFLRKTIHGEDQIAMAYFPRHEAAPSLENSKEEGMVQIPLSELKENTPIDFDIYIHLQMNNRYVKYTPQGGMIDGQQKQRLISKGVSNVHLRRESIPQVQKYRAEKFLNDKIDSFKDDKKKK